MELSGALHLVWLLPVLPAAGYLINTLFGRRLGLASGWIASLLVGSSFVIALLALQDLLSRDAGSRVAVLRGYRWIRAGDLSLSFDLRFDALSATLVLIITGVGFLIHLYSIGYMGHDRRPGTFFAYLNLFVASMLVLVLAQNFIVLFLGWEGVGLCSYLLIGFWYDRPGVPPAAKKAFIANRIGDAGFLLATFLTFQHFRSLDFDVIFSHLSGLATGTATAIALLFFLGCAGKSAQIPLYVWLPDAMAGPTPVSALIHAATMVTAGVYLVARTHPIFELSPTAQSTVVVIGALTALLAAVIAIGQDDIKRILAYSTVSQLGYMFIGVGLGPIGYAAGIFHLVTHAFFKAQLFLGAGSVMHGNADDTDVKHFGGLRTVMPITFATMTAAWLAILGIPPFSGFFSKEQILAAAFEHGGVGYFGWGVGVLTAGITAFYMSRLYFLTFFGKARWPEGRHPHESPLVMTLPLLVLGFLALVGGLLNTSHVSGKLTKFLEPVFAARGGAAAEVTANVPDLLLTVLTVGLALIGAAIAWMLYGSGRVDWAALRARHAGVWRVLANRLYVDEVYEFFTVTLGRALGAFLAVVVDQRVIDGVVNGVAEGVGAGGERGRRVQSGFVRTYAVGVLTGAVVLLAVLVLRT